MLHYVDDTNRKENQDLLDQMYELRARSFKERLGWRVEVINGREYDYFDDLNPLYVIVSDGAGTLLASLRLLPTPGPHMLADVFPEVMGDKQPIRNPLVRESSRFCVNTDASKNYAQSGINTVTRELLRGLFENAYEVGMMNVVSVYDIYVERILKRAGCTFERLGPVVRYDEGLKTTCGLFEVSEDVIESLTDEVPVQKTEAHE
ncbi:acyl-homoserine-lactone synthase [Salipiger mucosus]|uniref:Acyl-homoserine-lactone synthase n=1 Tax=Salipiger mucosus DSM 16094 TaxID=1123237 RepID=S9Q5W2_9RHOB|nr:acyl-homoserine-lactone synthase [Salipiger mucosus]EPX76771.1 autoinducer synthesis protein TraI [Salipiger mucosus DSM 16094]